jgi:hypothetical protein
MLVLADQIKNLTFIPTTGFLDTLFHQSWIDIKVLGNPSGVGYRLTLIGLLITLVIALTANFVTEFLTSKKVSLFTATVITILGSILFQTFVMLPFDFELEGVRVISALLGAIVVAVFYVLISGKAGGKK